MNTILISFFNGKLYNYEDYTKEMMIKEFSRLYEKYKGCYYMVKVNDKLLFEKKIDERDIGNILEYCI